METKKPRKKYPLTILIFTFYVISAALYFSRSGKMFLVSEELHQKPAVAGFVFMLSALLGIISAVFVDRIIFSARIKSWRWKIGLIFGVIGFICAIGSCKPTDGIAEKTIQALVGFWFYVIIGFFIGWIVDFFMRKKRTKAIKRTKNEKLAL